MSSTQPSAVCFGEILWDVLPDKAMPGGAPMNVAYHLNKLGIKTSFISRVGDDDQGHELLRLLQGWNISTSYCQIDKEHKTSEVLAKVGNNHEVTYEILYPVAWDFIAFQKEFEELIAAADAFIFGSLITRNQISANTLLGALNFSKYAVFDINLRTPHYSFETIKQLLAKTNLLKLNAAELVSVASWYNASVTDDEAAIDFLQNEFNIDEIIVTRGSKGASYIHGSSRVDCYAYKVEVADTIGSGDSFLAGFLSKKLQGAKPEEALQLAAALAAFVTSQEGACPDYTVDELEKFRERKEQEMQGR
jgi:fructokinase